MSLKQSIAARAGALLLLLPGSAAFSQYPSYNSFGGYVDPPYQRPQQQQRGSWFRARQDQPPQNRGAYSTYAPSYSWGETMARPGPTPPQEAAEQDQAPVRYEEYIPPTEQPGPNAAKTVMADGTQQSRPLNFPRDPGDDVDVLKLQVYLDYHGYSVGEIDGHWGYNTERALYVYQKNNGMSPTGKMDSRILQRLDDFKDGYLLDYTVISADTQGPFRSIPRDYYAQAKLKWLPYESQSEKLAERFHCSQSLLRKLNPGVDLDNVRAGQRLHVPNVTDGIDEKRGKVATVRISKNNKWAEAYDSEGRFMFYFPTTLGSQYDPLPIGNYQITGVTHNPTFEYKPWLFWDVPDTDPGATIPPGPNSPVGNVWIGTSRKSVGIHGTPNPEFISKNTSHGCIRMTNWDVAQLSKRVEAGTKLEFVQ